MNDTPPVACSLDREGLAARSERWRALADRALVRRVETDSGLQIVFRAEAGVADELRELALLERECCPFAAWEVTTTDGHAELAVTGGGEEAIAAVKQMFRALRS
jgi:hypothetical protein